MGNKLLRKILSTKKTCYFISPHFDDSILSAGALMIYLAQFTKVVVINVFTKADKPPYTFSAKSYLKQCAYSNAEKLFNDRKTEDSLALKGIASQIINLDLTDALWRKKKVNQLNNIVKSIVPELIHIYPTYYFHIVRAEISENDQNTLFILEKELASKVRNGITFCPLGIGGHVDHIIVRSVCEKLFNPLLYWADYPYINRIQIRKPKEQVYSYSFQFNRCRKEKKNIIQKYQTQYNAMFGNRELLLEKELFFTNDKI